MKTQKRNTVAIKSSKKKLFSQYFIVGVVVGDNICFNAGFPQRFNTYNEALDFARYRSASSPKTFCIMKLVAKLGPQPTPQPVTLVTYD